MPEPQGPKIDGPTTVTETSAKADGVESILPERYSLPPAEEQGEFFVYQRELSPGMRLEQYEIISVLGNGGFGITYLVKDLFLDRNVVLKENFPSGCSYRDPLTGHIRPNNAHDLETYNWSLQNFLSEAQTLAKLDHPGIVKIHSVFEANGTAYFAMDYVTGLSLDYLEEKLHTSGHRYTEDELKGLLIRLLKILDYLHKNNIYHRDIKPGNILLTEEGTPVLLDFGSARHAMNMNRATTLFTQGYSSPEQALGKSNIGPWSDLYSLGATFYSMLMGQHPDRAEARLIEDTQPPLHSNEQLLALYSRKFLLSLDKAMSPQIDKRYRDAEEWMHDICPSNAELSDVTIQITREDIQQARSKITKKIRHFLKADELDDLPDMRGLSRSGLKRHRQYILLPVGALCTVLLVIFLFLLVDYVKKAPMGTTFSNVTEVIKDSPDDNGRNAPPEDLFSIRIPELSTAEGVALERKNITAFTLKLNDSILSKAGLPSPLPDELSFSCIYLQVQPQAGTQVFLTIRTEDGKLIDRSLNPLPDFVIPGQTATSFYFPALPALQTDESYVYTFESQSGQVFPVQIDTIKTELDSTDHHFPKIRIITASPNSASVKQEPHEEDYNNLMQSVCKPSPETTDELLRIAPEHMHTFKQLSAEGYPVAQYVLARTLLEKGGKDAEEGARWLYRSASAGSYGAMRTLGIMLMDIPAWFPQQMQQPALLHRDYSQAARFLKMALQYRDQEVLYLLSLMYSQGWGVPVSKELSMQIMKHLDGTSYLLSGLPRGINIPAFWLPLPPHLQKETTLKFSLPRKQAAEALREICMHNTCREHPFTIRQCTLIQNNEVILDIGAKQEILPGKQSYSLGHFIPNGIIINDDLPLDIEIRISPGRGCGIVEMPGRKTTTK